jgi:methionine-rich copper-binding protein CopC
VRGDHEEFAMNLRSLLTNTAVCGVLAGLAPPAALAHAMLTRSAPAAGAVVSAAPKSLELEFDHPARITQITVVDAAHAGREIPVELDRTAPSATRFALPLAELAPGKYTVAWRALAADGHAMSGHFEFTVSK